MTRYEAPAKLNLSLHVGPPGPGGYHPLVSLVQTVEWCDLLIIEEGEGHDSLEIVGLDLEVKDNLVLAALEEVRQEGELRPLHVVLEKRLPVAAGLGGGSSDAAAALLAARRLAGLSQIAIDRAAARVGSDVTLFLTGGTLEMSGLGDEIEPLGPLQDVAFAIVVPEFGLDTAEVYARWDEMEGPEGELFPRDLLPPALRAGMPMRNDLLPAALDLEPRLGDFMADMRSAWGTAVCLTGSGSACFAYFATLDEASDAASAVSPLCSVSTGVALRDHGVAKA